MGFLEQAVHPLLNHIAQTWLANILPFRIRKHTAFDESEGWTLTLVQPATISHFQCDFIDKFGDTPLNYDSDVNSLCHTRISANETVH